MGVQTNEGVVIHGNGTTSEQPINIGNTTREDTFSPSSEVRVKYTKDGAWLICGSDDESEDMAASSQKNANVCWKCERERGGGEGGALLLICSRSECAEKVHKKCLNCQVHVDDNSFHYLVCWYD